MKKTPNSLKVYSLYLIITCFLITGCLNEKRLARICPLCPQSNEIIEKTITVYKDSLITVPLPADTIRTVDSIPCDNLIMIPKKTYIIGMITVEAWVINNWLNIHAFLNRDSIKTVVKIKEVQINHEIKTIRNVPTIIKKVPFYCWVIISLEGILILLLLFLFIRSLLKI